MVALPGEDDHADLGVVAGDVERVGQLEQGLGPEGVAHLGPADRDLGDAVGGLVADVVVVAGALPVDRGVQRVVTLVRGGGHEASAWQPGRFAAHARAGGASRAEPELRRTAPARLGRGDAVFPVDLRLAGACAGAVLDAMAPTWLGASEDGWTRRAGGRPVEEGDALVVATSGTTGAPQGVVLTHDAVRASAEATSERLGVDPRGDRWLACLPLAHVGGLSVVTRAIVTGTPLERASGIRRRRRRGRGAPRVHARVARPDCAPPDRSGALPRDRARRGCAARGPATQRRDDLRDDRDRQRCRLRRTAPRRRRGGDRRRRRHDPAPGPDAAALLPRRRRPEARRRLAPHRRRRRAR